jgi:hypothetical protein
VHGRVVGVYGALDTIQSVMIPLRVIGRAVYTGASASPGHADVAARSFERIRDSLGKAGRHWHACITLLVDIVSSAPDGICISELPSGSHTLREALSGTMAVQ